MTRGLLVAAALALGALILIALLAFARPPTGDAAASPSPTGSVAVSTSPSASPTLSPSQRPTTSATATATANPTASPSPTPNYVNAAWSYSLVLPSPYRHSELLSFASPPPAAQPKASDVFTAWSPADEQAGTKSCETACPAFDGTASVAVYTDAGSMSPRQFYEAGRAGRSVTEQLADATVAGAPALRVLYGARYPDVLIVANAGRMYVIAYDPREPLPAGATLEKLHAIVASFAFVP